MDELNLSQLQAECRKVGISHYGNRAELIAKLQENAREMLLRDTPVDADETGSIPEDVEAQQTTGIMQETAQMNMVGTDVLPDVGGSSEPVKRQENADVDNPFYIPSEGESRSLTSRPAVAVDEVKKLVDEINRRYGQWMKAVYNPHHETIDFTGGPQRKWTTTVHQPFRNILGLKTSAADQYARICMSGGGLGATGSLSTIN